MLQNILAQSTKCCLKRIEILPSLLSSRVLPHRQNAVGWSDEGEVFLPRPLDRPTSTSSSRWSAAGIGRPERNNKLKIGTNPEETKQTFSWIKKIKDC